MASRREDMDVVELSSFNWARWKRALSPVRGAKRWASLRSTNSSSVGGVSWFVAQRSVKRFHRTLTGASTLTNRKKGRRNKASTTLSSQMSVVTHRSCHLKVTKSSSVSTSWKVDCSSSERASGEGTCALDADFSTAGVVAVRARRIRLKLCSSTRYEAIEDLPAQIPGSSQEPSNGATERASLPPHNPISMVCSKQVYLKTLRCGE